MIQSNELDHGRRVQQDSISSLGHTLTTIAETKHVAINIASTLHGQTEQIDIMTRDIYEIDNMLTRGVKIIKRIGRRLLSNKYLWVLIFLSIVGIGFIIYFEVI